MPIYEFECRECGARFEKLVQKASEKPEVKCPACAGNKLEEQISTFASGANPGSCAPTGS
jgi:putative FmdB family regulatory protein